MTAAAALDRGREALARHAWADAHALLSAADREATLEPDDLERLALAACLAGKDADSADAWARAHQAFLSRGAAQPAVRCAFWLGFGLLNRGERARGGAWIARARGILGDAGLECAERGYLLLPDGLARIGEGDAAGAEASFREAGAIADRFGDTDLAALARHSRGRALIRLGRIAEGVTLLDQAMVAIEARELSPLVVGDVYCSAIEGFLEVFDLRRAREWTTSLTRWCESQPELVAYSGQCLVRRAEILQLHGAWRDAVHSAQQACERFLLGSDQPAAGAAHYQQAELHRLRGEFDDAEEAYRRASRSGREPQPGLALLRLAQGRLKDAETAIRAALLEASNPRARSRLLPAHVEVMLAASDLAAARASADELAKIAEPIDAQLPRAIAAQARGAVLLAEGDAEAALATLRRAWSLWQELEAPYEAARVRVQIGLACRALGHEDAAAMEFDAARWIFQQLEARADLLRADELSRRSAPDAAAGGLSARELQVLRLVAAGKSNRAIGDELFISERTVERHLGNIFGKLDVSSRAAATAFAYEHKLV